MRKLLLAAALAGTTLTTAAATAQTSTPAPKARADANGDGTVTRAEFIAQAGARFDARDANRNRTIAPDERHRQMRADARPTTRAEAMTRADAMFDRLDTNKDGALSDAERWSAMGRMGGRRGGGTGMMTPPAGGPGAPGMGRGGKMMERVDTNKDGRISRDEMRAQADTRFARLDANNDGYLDQGELRPAHRGMKHRSQGGDIPPPPVPPVK